MITSPKEPTIFEQDVHYYSTNHQEVPASQYQLLSTLDIITDANTFLTSMLEIITVCTVTLVSSQLNVKDCQ